MDEEWFPHDTYKTVKVEWTWCKNHNDYHFRGTFSTISTHGDHEERTLVLLRADDLYSFIDELYRPTPIKVVRGMLSLRKHNKSRKRALRKASTEAWEHYEEE